MKAPNIFQNLREKYSLLVGILLGIGWILYGAVLLVYHADYRNDDFIALLLFLTRFFLVSGLLISLLVGKNKIFSLFLKLGASFMIFYALPLLVSYGLGQRSDIGGGGGIGTLLELLFLWWPILIPVAVCLLWLGIVIESIYNTKKDKYLLLSLLPLLCILILLIDPGISIASYMYFSLGILCIIIGILVYRGQKSQTDEEMVETLGESNV